MWSTTPTTATTTRPATPTRAGGGGGDVQDGEVVRVLDPGLDNTLNSPSPPTSLPLPSTLSCLLLPLLAPSPTSPDISSTPAGFLSRRFDFGADIDLDDPDATRVAVFNLRHILNFNIALSLSISPSPCAPERTFKPSSSNLVQLRFNTAGSPTSFNQGKRFNSLRTIQTACFTFDSTIRILWRSVVMPASLVLVGFWVLFKRSNGSGFDSTHQNSDSVHIHTRSTVMASD
ncbi:hypothetical protein R3P38DRAFT_3174857 [Favolaschia claudopus]|uniref:Uncharacterized protein n=1 Tax=Favolaschia claudopus TaxID=2862362 RepID=A0AAW0DBS6_9AGAR